MVLIASLYECWIVISFKIDKSLNHASNKNVKQRSDPVERCLAADPLV
jgi:hypothetical protein